MQIVKSAERNYTCISSSDSTEKAQEDNLPQGTSNLSYFYCDEKTQR